MTEIDDDASIIAALALTVVERIPLRLARRIYFANSRAPLSHAELGESMARTMAGRGRMPISSWLQAARILFQHREARIEVVPIGSARYPRGLLLLEDA